MALLFSVLAFLVIAIILIVRNEHSQVIKHLQDSWGKHLHKHQNQFMIGKFFRLLKSSGSFSLFDNSVKFSRLSSQTLNDIDIFRLYNYLDRTNSAVGQQYLYASLTHPVSDKQHLERLQKEMDVFCTSPDQRIELQYLLHRFEKAGSSKICELFDEDDKREVTKYKRWYLLLTLSSVLVVPFIVFVPTPSVLVFAIIVYALNLNLHYIMRHRNDELFTRIRQANQLIRVANKLSKKSNPVDGSLVGPAVQSLAGFRRSYRFLDLGVPMNDLSSVVYYLLDLIKALFLVEVHLMSDVYQKLLSARPALLDLYKYVGRTDMILSVASVKAGTEKICHPVFVDEPKKLAFTNAIHPLVFGCVPNSLELARTGLFITGSNMSGKSTFLRTVLINSILAQTICLCFADSYTSSFMDVSSSVKIADDLQDGSSYYFTEVNVVHEMVKQVNTGSQNLFVIDEIFKGTNTLERIALAKSILQYLNTSENIVIASSHDMELLALLGDEFTKAHFIESIVDNHLSFEFKLKIGEQEARNAIRIIEMEGFPEAIVQAAIQQTKASPGHNK